jgi:hypothetical protein
MTSTGASWCTFLKRAALSGSWLGRLPDDAGLRHLVASIEQRDALRVLDRHE